MKATKNSNTTENEIENDSKNKIIEITENYRISIDSKNYVVQKLTEIDPTQSPMYDPNKHDSKIYYKWKDDGYFGIRDNGLVCAIKRIILRETDMKIDNKTELKEYIELFKKVSDEVIKIVKSKRKEF